MARSVADLDVLSTAGWLACVPPHFRREVLARGVVRHYAKGDMVYRLGETSGGVYGLIAGSVGIAIASSRRGTALAHLGQPGFWFGEGPFITREPRRVQVWAARRTVLLSLPLPLLDAMTADDPETWRWLAVLTMSNLDLAMSVADDLMIRDPAKRCLAVLLRIAGASATVDHAPVVNASQDELAQMANVSRTVASAVLRDQRARGRIGLAYRQIRLLDVAGLRADADETEVWRPAAGRPCRQSDGEAGAAADREVGSIPAAPARGLRAGPHAADAPWSNGTWSRKGSSTVIRR